MQLALVVLAVSCAGGQPSGSIPARVAARSRAGLAGSQPSPIRHVVIIVQENRSTDNLFQAMKSRGANIQSWAIDSLGEKVALREVTLGTRYDLGHAHASFVRDYDCGKMDGFDSGLIKSQHLRPFTYAPLSEVRPYVDMAEQYAFADNMFETQQAGSFPAHQYIVSGSASGLPETTFNVSGDPFNRKTKAKVPAGCDGPALGVVDTIDPVDGSAGPTPPPCFNRPVLSDLLDARGATWRYYQNGLGPGLWHAMDAIKHVRYGPDYVNVVTPPETIFTDVTTGNLPNVSWVMPADGLHSDHPGYGSAAGPSWVAAVVNAIGGSQYWNSTAIFLIWDDWGGLYDHVVPPMMNNWYELGFRVPLVVISPYAKRAYVSHVQHEFGSILAFTEETFGIRKGALNATDVRADDLSDAFNYNQKVRPFVTISAPPFKPGGGPSSVLNAEDPDGGDGAAPASGSCMTAR